MLSRHCDFIVCLVFPVKMEIVIQVSSSGCDSCHNICQTNRSLLLSDPTPVSTSVSNTSGNDYSLQGPSSVRSLSWIGLRDQKRGNGLLSICVSVVFGWAQCFPLEGCRLGSGSERLLTWVCTVPPTHPGYLGHSISRLQATLSL